LQLLGNPIANDPCYGGRLFYGDDQRRAKAVELLRTMKSEGYHPISKVPHFDDHEIDQFTADRKSAMAAASLAEDDDVRKSKQLAEEGANASIHPTIPASEICEVTAAEVNISRVDSSTSEGKLSGETDQDFLIRTCK
jgi:hypothetical protein